MTFPLEIVRIIVSRRVVASLALDDIAPRSTRVVDVLCDLLYIPQPTPGRWESQVPRIPALSDLKVRL